ncbi:unnamed protein product [Cyprideis torosa]|uniref:Uncharacterized protein n=1 Tax=Cyprideis torosa TaxID=163714 RepID=A0A7R8W732_9CRUS|nr:unnamed protein product [Cyprideis torosa]CAG0881983.1 unnamed protein product [Cyprideis torosa]
MKNFQSRLLAAEAGAKEAKEQLSVKEEKLKAVAEERNRLQRKLINQRSQLDRLRRDVSSRKAESSTSSPVPHRGGGLVSSDREETLMAEVDDLKRKLEEAKQDEGKEKAVKSAAELARWDERKKMEGKLSAQRQKLDIQKNQIETLQRNERVLREIVAKLERKAMKKPATKERSASATMSSSDPELRTVGRGTRVRIVEPPTTSQRAGRNTTSPSTDEAPMDSGDTNVTPTRDKKRTVTTSVSITTSSLSSVPQKDLREKEIRELKTQILDLQERNVELALECESLRLKLRDVDRSSRGGGGEGSKRGFLDLEKENAALKRIIDTLQKERAQRDVFLQVSPPSTPSSGSSPDHPSTPSQKRRDEVNFLRDQLKRAHDENQALRRELQIAESELASVRRELEGKSRLAANAKILLRQAAERENSLMEQQEELLKKLVKYEAMNSRKT